MDSGGHQPAYEPVRDRLADAVATFESGECPHVAVVADPFAGREGILDTAESLLADTADSVDRIEVTAPLEDASALRLPDTDAVVVGGCRYLYSRHIDGFGALEAFADRLAAEDTLFVTAWNRYAWHYITQVRNVDDLFAVEIEVPRLDSDDIAALLTAETSSDVRFEVGDLDDDTAEAGVTLPLPGRPTVSLPRVGLWGRDEPDDVRSRVFQALTRRSMGNPGVARALWETVLTDGVVSLHDVRATDTTFDIPDAEAFALAVLVSKERLDRSHLRHVLGDRLFERSLRQLRQYDAVRTEGSTVTLRPAVVADAVSFLERRRLLW